MSKFYDFIQVYVFTTNHHLKLIKIKSVELKKYILHVKLTVYCTFSFICN